MLPVLEFAHVAQSAEHILGKNEVMGSNPIVGFLPRSLEVQDNGRRGIVVEGSHG